MRRPRSTELADHEALFAALEEVALRVNGRRTSGQHNVITATQEIRDVVRSRDDRYVDVKLSLRHRRLIRWAIARCIDTL